MEDAPLTVDTPSTDTAQAAPPSPASTDNTPSTPVTAGDTAVATDAASVFRELQGAKSDGTPPDTPPDPSHAQAATQPDGSPEAPGSLPNRGPIPFDRHQAVLTRTRNEVGEKARRETLDEFGIGGLSAEEVRTGVTMLQSLKRGGVGFLDYLRNQIDPQAAAAPVPQKPAEDPEPEPDIPLADGRATMSLDRLREWNAWNERRLTKQFDEKYGPIRDEHELNKLTETRRAEATQLVTLASGQWPRFQQLKPLIRDYVERRYPKGQPLPPTALYDAYIAMDREHGERLLREKWDAERSGQLTRKATASTVQPGAPRPSTPRPDSELTTRDIIRQEARRLAAG
jgi:hypothetical protein